MGRPRPELGSCTKEKIIIIIIIIIIIMWICDINCCYGE
jgi:hypothetical protein